MYSLTINKYYDRVGLMRGIRKFSNNFLDIQSCKKIIDNLPYSLDEECIFPLPFIKECFDNVCDYSIVQMEIPNYYSYKETPTYKAAIAWRNQLSKEEENHLIVLLSEFHGPVG